MADDVLKREKALVGFYSSFGLPVYDETSVPDNAELPYITCEIKTGQFDYAVPSTVSLYYYSTSWTAITKKAREIINACHDGKRIKYDGGGMTITIPSQDYERMSDAASDMIRRIVINTMVEFVN